MKLIFEKFAVVDKKKGVVYKDYDNLFGAYELLNNIERTDKKYNVYEPDKYQIVRYSIEEINKEEIKRR
jgi:hypothetical protein